MVAKLNFDNQQCSGCKQGASFTKTLTWKDSNGDFIDLTSYSIKMQIRKNYKADLIIELSTENDRIQIDSGYRIVLNLTPTETVFLTPGQYIYDLKLDDGAGTVTYLLEGTFVITANVTQ